MFAGSTNSYDYPTVNSLQPYMGNGTLGTNVVVTKLSPDGSEILFSTFLGGTTNYASTSGIAVDGTGNIYVTGATSASDFPTTSGAFQSSPESTSCVFAGSTQPCSHAFVAKIDPAAGRLIYSTYLSGGQTDVGLGVAIDATGRMYVCGYTQSADFPTTSMSFQPSYGGGAEDGFVTAFNPDGSLLASTFLGGNALDSVTGIALDPAGDVVVTGETLSANFPVAQPFQATLNGNSDAFVTVLSPQLTAVQFSSYLGGSASDGALAIAVDIAGDIYLGGSTESQDFPVTSGAVQTHYGGSDQPSMGGDGFIAKIDGVKRSIIYASYIGGSSIEEVSSLGTNLVGDATVFMTTFSTNLPTVNALQSSYPAGGFYHSYLATFAPDGKSLSFATYLGGNGDDAANGLAVSPCGAVTPFLGTSSTNLPTVNALYSSNMAHNAIYYAQIGGGRDFAVGVSPATVSMSSGGSASATVELRACGGFNGSVQLSCSGAPAGYTCKLASSSVQLNGAQNVGLTIAPTGTAANGARAAPLMALGAVFLVVFPRRRKKRSVTVLTYLFLGLVLCLAMPSCGGGGSSPSTSGGNSGNVVTVSATSGGITHNAQIALSGQ